MRKRVKWSATFLALVCLAAQDGALAATEDWPMVQRDPAHTGKVRTAGPVAPLRQAWSARADGLRGNDTSWPVLYDGTVYVSSGPSILAVDAASGERRWIATPPDGGGTAAPAVDGSAVYVPVPSEHLLALDRQSGKEIWRFATSSDVSTSPTLADGRLFFGAAESKTFYCVDAKSGENVWQVVDELEPHGVSAVAEGIVVFSTRDLQSTDGFLVALDANTGEEKWRVPQFEYAGSPSILEDRVVAVGYDHVVRAFELGTGREVWRSEIADAAGSETFPAVAFGDVFIVDRSGTFYRLDGDTGEQKWSFSDTEGTFDQSSPLIAGDALFVGGGAGWIHAVNVENGKHLWKVQVGGYVNSGSADGERFYVGVKHRNEGVYAYEHDPEGQLLPTPFQRRNRVLVRLLVGLGILGTIGLGLLIVSRRRDSRSAGA